LPPPLEPESFMNTAVKTSKRELTRAKVVQAAIDCISEVGFNAAHTNRIAEKAGVSWGVLQYHFGDKDGLLQAVLDYIFDDFSSTLENTNLDGEDMLQRVTHLIDAIWALVSKREYRVSLAILRNAGKDEQSKIDGERQLTEWSKNISELWKHLLADTPAKPAQSEAARHLMFSALRGMADDINPDSRSKQSMRDERGALAIAITHLLCGSSH
jgi:AcrR family transcriptional regulator